MPKRDRCSKRLTFAVVALAPLAGLVSACASTSRETAPSSLAVYRAVPQLMHEALVPGLQMATIKQGRIQVLAFGVANVQSGDAVTEETVFEAASLGKPVLAYAVLKLASEGRIDIDTPIGRYIVGLSDTHANVTARQLLSHSAGLPNTGSEPAGTSVQASKGSRFSYSGEGFKLLQRLVERITNRSMQDHMEQEVFKPLGMASSSSVWRDEYAALKAFGHGYTGNSAGRSRIVTPQAASSLETTAGDYARFALAAVRGTGLRRDLARQLLQPQVTLEEGCVVCVGKAPGNKSPHHWGLGFGLEKVAGRTFAWHWGDNQTMQSYVAIDSTGDHGVVVLTNSANGHSITRQLASDVLSLDAPGYAWLDTYSAHTAPTRRLLSSIVRNGVASLSAVELTDRWPELRQVAERLLAGGRPEDAAAVTRRLITSGQATGDDHALLADALRRSGRLPEAHEVATAAARLHPGNGKVKLALERVEQSQRVIPATDLARYAGRYSSPFGPMEVRSDGRRLTAHLLDQPSSDMLPLSNTSFLMEAMGVPIEFVTGTGGAVTHAVVRAGGEIKLPRIP